MINQIQKNYLVAKANYDAVNAEMNDRTAPLNHLLNEGKIDEYTTAEMKIAEELGQSEIWNTMIDAKDALIAWGYEIVKSQPQYKNNPQNAADLDRVFQAAMKRTYPSITEKLVKLVLSLDTSTLR